LEPVVLRFSADASTQDGVAAVGSDEADRLAARDHAQPADRVRALWLAGDELEPRGRARVLDDLRSWRSARYVRWRVSAMVGGPSSLR